MEQQIILKVFEDGQKVGQMDVTNLPLHKLEVIFPIQEMLGRTCKLESPSGIIERILSARTD